MSNPKILILKNKFTWSIEKRLKNIVKWFSSVDLEFTTEETKLDIVNGEYSYTSEDGITKYYKAVDETWYDQNISIPAKTRGFDIVVLLIKKQSWLSKIVEGFGTCVPDYGIEEIAIEAFKTGTYKFNGIKLKGDKLTWIIIHELLHRIYHIKGLTDNTHKYFLLGTPEKCLEDFMDTFSKEKFMSFYKGTSYESGASSCYDNISSALNYYGINSKLTLIGALATCRVEVGRAFLPIEEIASGEAYEGRAGLGNSEVGDGKRYKGRGYIQITGRANYKAYGEALGIDLINNPELALNSLISARILALYFKNKGIPTYCEAKNWTKVRKLVNGGDNGLSTFTSVINQYLAV